MLIDFIFLFQVSTDHESKNTNLEVHTFNTFKLMHYVDE